MKVRQLIRVADDFDIDEMDLERKAAYSEYWNEAHSFYLEVKNEFTSTLSEHQQQWLNKIEEQLND
jgi:hypothetical protein